MPTASSPIPLTNDDLLEQDETPLRIRRPREDVEMDITPMIDITFLLLIFFLVASTPDASARIEIPEARYAGAVSEKNSVFVSLAKDNGGSLVVYKSKAKSEADRCTAADPEELQAEIAEFISNQIANRGSDGLPKEFVVLNVQVGVTEREVEQVERAVARALVESPEVQLHHAVLEEGN